MKGKKFRFSALLTALLALVLSFALFACNKGKDEKPVIAPEVGVYYFSADADEYTLTLNDGNTFALIYKGESNGGSYKLENEAMTLKFDNKDLGTASATLTDGVVVLNYDGASMRFLKKINYTVAFDVKEGSAVKDQTVINGKTVVKPAEPTREGFIFVGWYGDEAYTLPYDFATPVSANTTLYARWTEESANEYLVDFDLGYTGASITPVKTIGGKLFDLATPTRDGYEFKGWWISMYEDGGKLTYQYTADMAFSADTTLFAMWKASSEAAAPAVSVEAGAIKWDAVAGSYWIEVLGPDGETLLSKPTTSTVENFKFADYEAGDYQITVSCDGASAVRYYKNKALGRVSQFEVIEPSVLVYNAVEGAEKYLVTVKCGNENHNHTQFDNGTSRNFNFANCEMKKGGIEFIVTAVADGYASTESEVFVYERNLDAVKGYAFNEATQTLSWNAVASASEYMVSVSCGNTAHEHEYFNNGSKTSVDLKECSGKIAVSVYPVAKGYNSPSTTSFKYNKAILATPASVKVSGTVVSWEAVKDATSYEVTVNGQVYSVTDVKIDLAEKFDLVEEETYTVTIKAKGATESIATDAIVTAYRAMGEVEYYASTVSWAPVLGADRYEIQVNNGEIVTAPADASNARISLNASGNNEVKVRFVSGSTKSDWAKTSVYAHRVVFDSVGGSLVEVQYKAIGDLVDAPKPTKYGYKFANWYTTPQGPLSNGAAYTDEYFNEAGELVLFAFYDPKDVNVTYNFGVSGSGDSTGAVVSYDREFTLEVPVSSDGTSAFAGWFTAPNGTGVQLTDAKGKSLTTWNEIEDTEVYAFFVNQVLAFTRTKLNGKDVYAVSAGARFGYLSEITVPAYYNGLPVAIVSGSAFVNASTLKVINLPNTIESVSSVDPFAGCVNLEAINVYEAEGVADYRYYSEGGVLFDYGTFSLGAGAKAKLAYMPLAKTGTYRIPYGVEEIPSEAFANSKVSKVVIPATVTNIGVEAFASCKNLTFVVFETDGSDKPLTIDARAFSECTSLETIVLPKRLQSIGLSKYSLGEASGNAMQTVKTEFVQDAFIGCTKLENISVSSANAYYKSIDGVLFDKSGSELIYAPATLEGDYEIPNGVNSIAPGAFAGCNSLGVVTIPETVTSVGECAFYDSGVQGVIFKGNGYNAVTIGKYAFRACGNLTEVEFESGNKVETIKEGAFAESGLKTFEIPAKVTSVEKQAFYRCVSLAEVSFAPNGAALTFGEDVFYECRKLATITIPATLTKLPDIFNGCKSLETVNVDPLNESLASEEGVLFNKDKTEILFFPASNDGEDGVYTLPETVTKIGNGVFRDNSVLTKVVISNVIEYIGADAFRDTTALEEVEFTGETSATALEIADGAFMGSSIETITLPAHATTLGASAFQGTGNLYSITLNEGLTNIGDYAFHGSAIEEIVIPSTVKYIGASAFEPIADDYGYYDYQLASITITDTQENPSQLLEIGDRAFYETAIEEIVVPASVVRIGDYAFYADYYYYASLESLTFAENGNLEYIGKQAFYNQYWLNQDLVIPASVTYIGEWAFYYTKINGLTIADGEADLVLGDFAFAKTQYLTITAVADRLKVIGDYAFSYSGYYSDGLNFNFSETSRLERIGEGAFAYNRENSLSDANLVSIVIPKSVKNTVDEDGNVIFGIGENAFYYVDALESITFATGGTDALTIGASAFYGTDGLTEITLPARLAPATVNDEVVAPLANGAKVFESSDNLANVFVEDAANAYYKDIDGVLYTADGKELVFCPNGKTGTVTVPGTVTKIHDYAFAAPYEAMVEEIVFEGGTEDMTIGNNAFENCTSLTSIVLPANVVSLGKEAFLNCTSLTSIALSGDLSNFEMSMLSGCPIEEINVSDSNFYMTQDGILFTADGQTLVSYPVKATATTYTVPNGVKRIAANAFKGNTALEQVTLPAGLIEIQADAFNGCSNLASINIPNTVEVIDQYAFVNCKKLATVTFEEGGESKLVLGKNSFAQTNALETVELPARVSTLGEQVFYYGGLASIEFASGSQLTEIGAMAFYRTKLVSVEIPAGVEYIGDSAFYSCASLKTVTIGEGLVEIGSEVFTCCESLESVAFPSSLKTMGINTFFDDYYEEGCADLKSVTFGENSQLEAIPMGTFAGCGLESIVIPASVKEIGGRVYDPDNYSYDDETHGAFEGCANLTTVVFEGGSQLATIGHYAFAESGIESFESPSLVGTIGNYAFTDCTSLKNVSIGEFTTKLGTYMFEGCYELVRAEINASVLELPAYTFNGCSSLEEVTLSSTIAIIGEDSFRNCESFTSIELPASITTIKNAFSGSGLAEYVVAPGNTTFASVDGVLFSADFTQLISWPAGKQATTFTIPKEVTSIADYTFSGLETLEEIIFEDGGKAPLIIGAYAFAECTALKSVTLPERLISIGESVFEYCESLQNIVIPDNVTAIPYRAFAYCYSLKTAVIGDGVEYLDDDSFYYCDSLYILTLGASLKEINSDAFGYYNESILEVYNRSNVNLNLDNAYDYRLEALMNVYTPTEGESIFSTEGDWTFINQDEEKLVFKYNGSETEVTLPEADDMYEFFLAGSDVTSVTIPDGYTKIAPAAFVGAVNLVSVVLPASVTEIGEQAFYSSYNYGYLDKFTTINLENVTTIGEQAFYYCESLEEVDLSSAVAIDQEAFYGCDSLTSVTLPLSLESVGSKVFYNISNITVFCVAGSKPDGWSSSWDTLDYYDAKANVLWGYTGEDVTYTFTTGVGGLTVDSITSNGAITLPTGLTRADYVFKGWYYLSDPADETSKVFVSTPYYNPAQTALTADWMTQAEFEAQFAGTAPEYAIAVDGSFTATGINGDEFRWYKWVATETATYNFATSTGGGDTKLRICDATGNKITGDDGGYEESRDVSCTAGETYIVAVCWYSSSTSDINVVITKK